MKHSLLLLLSLTVCATTVRAQSIEARREEVDGGVHIPVMTKPPALLEFVPAAYPHEAEARGLTAAVTMQVTIGPDGVVADAQVKEPLSGNGFDEAALDAVRRFRFSAAEVDGKPAPVTIEYVYHFELKPKVPAADAKPPAFHAVLSGQALARGSRKRVQNATVRCGDDPEAPEVLTNAEGQFRLELTEPLCKLRLLADDYERFDTDETLADGESREVRYFLIPKAIGYETVVRGKRDKKEVVRRTLDRSELQKVPGTFGDPIRVIQNLPGVARAPFLSGALIVRGATPRQTATLMDGVSIPLLFHLSGGPSVVNSEFLDKLDFYPGGFGARYGRATGGVVDVTTRRGATDTTHGVAKVDVMDASAFIQAPVGENASVAAAVRRSYVDALLPFILPLVAPSTDGSSLSVAPSYWDYQVRADYGRRTGKNGAPPSPSTFYLMAFGSDDKLVLASSGPSQPRDLSLKVHTLFHRVKGDWTYRKDKFTNDLAPYLGYDLQAAQFNGITFNEDSYSLGLRDDAALDLNRYMTLRFGADILFNNVVGRAKLPTPALQYVGFPGAEPQAQDQVLHRNVNAFDGALYSELDFKLGRFTFTPGLRATYARLAGQNRGSVDPRAWVRYQLFAPTSLKASVGLYTQAPDANNMVKAPFGNPALSFERAFQLSGGVEQKLTDVINLDLVGFYNRRFENVIAPGPSTVNPDGSVTQLRYANNGLGRSYGLEVMLRHEVTRNFFGWVAYTLSRTENRVLGNYQYTLGPYDQTHILTVVGSYRLPLGFEVGTRYRYVTGNPQSTALHPFDVFQADGNAYFPSSTLTQNTRLPSFSQWDIRVEKNFLLTQWTLTAYVDCQNVLNTKNTETTFYDYRYRNQVPVPGIPLLPIVGVRGSF